MSGEWILLHKGGVGRFEVSFPGNTAPDPLPSYVRLEVNGHFGYFRPTTRRGASGNQLWLSPAALTSAGDGHLAKLIGASALSYRWHKLIRDRQQLFFVVPGLLLQLASLVVDASLAIGKVSTIIDVGKEGVIASLVASVSLKAIGATLVFLKGVLAGDS